MSDSDNDSNSNSTSQVKDLDLLMGAFNPSIRTPIRSYSSELKRYYNNKLFSDIIDLYNYDEVSENAVKLILNEFPTISEETKASALKFFNESSDLDKASIEIICTKLKNIIYSVKLKRITNSGKSPIELVSDIQNLDVSLAEASELDKLVRCKSLSDIDVSKVIEDLGTPIYSSVQAINECFITGGYIKNQLINIIAPPSVGKSLFMMNEAIHIAKQGYGVDYVAIGDLSEIDFITRMCSITLGVTMNDATENLRYHYPRMKQALGEAMKNINTYYIDPDVISVQELEEYLKFHDLIKPNRVLFVDYDTNFRSENEMYRKGEEIYNKLCSLSKKGKYDLVFVAGQPKIQYYDHEIIPMEGGSESSRKQQILDLMITIGRNPDSLNPIGYLNLAKVRRGAMKQYFPYLLDPSGRFRKIDKKAYLAIQDQDKLLVPKAEEGLSEEAAAIIADFRIGALGSDSGNGTN